jgi:hypothetical protein
MEDAKKLKFEESPEKYEKLEYIFMGNSTTLFGVNPTVFDQTASLKAGSTFNAAMNGSDIKTIRDFACGYIISEIRPKNLVLLFSNISMIQDHNYKKLESNSKNLKSTSYLYRYRNTLRDPMTINTFLRVLKFRDNRQGLVYRWADNLDDSGYSKYENTSATFSEKGWNPKDKISLDLRTYVVKRSQLQSLTEIRDLAKKNGVNLIIGTVPLLSQDLEYRGTVQAIAYELGVDFIQGNDAIGQGQYFQDVIHLNRDGATLFSRFLAEKLSK